MNGKASLALYLWFSLCPLCLCVEPPSLEARLAPLAKAHKGKVAIAVKHLGTNTHYFLNADEPLPAAGLIHLPLMMEVYQQAAEGKLRLTDPVTLREQDKVSGSGILAEHFSAGATFPLRDAVRLMIAFSDNSAANLVQGKIGVASTNQRLETWSLRQTRVNARAPYEGTTTAREMILLLEYLETGKHFPPAMKQAILGHLKRCADKDRMARLLPANALLAHLTGSTTRVRNDAGILYLPDAAIALCVLSADDEDLSGRSELCAQVAREVYDYCAAGAGAAPAAQKP